MEIFIKGFLTGCVLSIMIGPVFFVLLETSIKRGVKAAIAFDLGVLLNDIVYIFIAYVFYNQVAELSQGENNSLVRIVGGVSATGLIDDLKELREFALKEQDPLVTKVLRLSYEYIGENGSFDVQAQYEEDEDENEYPIEIEDQENLLYLLNLLKNADHKINREEIKDYRTALKQELY